MKSLILTLFIGLIGTSAWATGDLTGKYHLQVKNHLSGMRGSYEFLLNSNADFKIWENQTDYYLQDFSVSPFFDQFGFHIEWGSDEERHLYSFQMINKSGQPEIQAYCALYIDGPNGVHSFDELGFLLQKWNKKKKVYEDIAVNQDEKSLKNCQKELAKNLSENSQTVF